MSFGNSGLLTGGTANVNALQTQSVAMFGPYGSTSESLSGNITNSNVVPSTIFTGYTYTNSDYQMVIRGRDTSTADTFITNMTLLPNGDYVLYNDMGNASLGTISVSVNGNTSEILVNVISTTSNTIVWDVDTKSYFG